MTSDDRPLRVARALISVSDKSGVVEFARGLAALGVEIISTGNTARALRDAGVTVREVSEHTGFPEMMDGRLKTLHPKVHGGILQRRDQESHRRAASEHGIPGIDLVAVNLYPFERTSARPDATLDESIEQIDIGGPAMIRSAAKNHAFVVVVVDPADYAPVLSELRGGGVRTWTRQALAVKAFRRTCAYDQAIAEHLAGAMQGDHPLTGARRMLRYGENPHQRGAIVSLGRPGDGSVAGARVQGGKEVSYNNLLDADAAWALAREFEAPAVVIVKHGTPCGVAAGATPEAIFEAAHAGDPLSAYGGVIACNRAVDLALAERVVAPKRFFEVIIAPGFTPDAEKLLGGARPWCRNLRLLSAGAAEPAPSSEAWQRRSVSGGYLLQSPDTLLWRDEELRVVTRAQPEAERFADMRFAMTVCTHVRSNAIVLARDRSLLGAGGGQPSRVDAARIALEKAGARAQGAVLASDAFFPFPDAVELALDAGVRVFVSPGGSKNDTAIIELCDRRDAVMVFTGTRHFRH